MITLLHKLGAKVKGVIEGFDRIVFKGRLMSRVSGKKITKNPKKPQEIAVFLLTNKKKYGIIYKSHTT